MKTTNKKSRKTIGWREWVELPELGIEAIKVKVDSGARTSALHATKIRYLEKHDGVTLVSFVVTQQLNPRKTIRVHAPLVEQRMVKSSLGHASLRPVIRTLLKIGKESWPVEITLINRDPDRWPEIEPGVRRVLFADHFPYSVVYIVRDGAVFVICVMHQHREPGNWRGRIDG